MEKPVVGYRLYEIDADDRVAAETPLPCRTTQEAIRMALARLPSCHAVEIRCGGRVVGRFGGSTPARWPRN